VRGRFRLQGGRNHLKHTIHTAHDVIIPKPEYPIIVFAQPAIAFKVALAFRVLSAVELNHQPPFTAQKIDYVIANRLLTYELMSVQRT
jgi:hypothetical protein